MNNPAGMNIGLPRQVMSKRAGNGGKVPVELQQGSGESADFACASVHAAPLK